MKTSNLFEKPISLLGLGCMRLPTKEAGKEDIDYDAAGQIVDEAIKKGITYFDTAYGYHDGDSERFLGKTLPNYPRESYNLASKLPSWYIRRGNDSRRILEEQMTRLNADYLDFYLLHSVQEGSWPVFRDHNCYEAVRAFREEGLIRHMGFSFHGDLPLLKELLDNYEWEFVQLQLNYYDWFNGSAKAEYDLVRAHGLPVIVMEPVMGGKLANLTDKTKSVLDKAGQKEKSYASWAIRFAASQEGVMTVLSGMSNIEQLRDNLQTMESFQPFSEEETALVEEASNAFREFFAIPCTGCAYCSVCPKKVEIPAIFSLYNAYNLDRNLEKFKSDYAASGFQAGVAACVDCKKCERFCPQEIKIPDRLRKIKELFGE